MRRGARYVVNVKSNRQRYVQKEETNTIIQGIYRQDNRTGKETMVNYILDFESTSDNIDMLVVQGGAGE